jgi:hypothetical protein
MAYRVLASLANNIVDGLLDHVPEGSTVVVQDAEGMRALAAYRAFLAGADLLVQAYDEIHPEAPVDEVVTEEIFTPGAIGAAAKAVIAAVGGAKDALGVVSGVFSLIQPRAEYAMREVTIADEALAAVVCGTLTRKRRRVLYPPLASAASDPAGDLAQIGAAMKRVWRSRHDARERTAATSDEAKPDAEARLATLDSMLGGVERTLLGTGKPDDGALAVLLRGANRHRSLGESGHSLFLRVVRAGGTERTTTRAASFRAPRHEFSGGVVATFYLFDVGGTLVTSGTEQRYRSFAEIPEER